MHVKDNKYGGKQIAIHMHAHMHILHILKVVFHEFHFVVVL